MDIINIEDFTKDNNELRKKCNKCNSIFVGESKCEVCGIQLEFDKLGDPLGERSFFTKKSEYWNSQSKIIWRYPYLERKRSKATQRYKRSMFNRYEVLVEYFANPHNLSGDRYNKNAHVLYFYELKSLIKEMISYNTTGQTLIKKLHKFEVSDELSTTFANMIKQQEQAYLDQKVTLYYFMFQYYIAGAIRPASLIIVSTMSIIVISFSLAYYRYLLFLQ
ncbi:MAG: hypothetical protein ISR65_14435 [Bacteriovoracaceae bacterium]|nr:hypothetical protein [Bacteriovoracaceae bacterium]